MSLCFFPRVFFVVVVALDLVWFYFGLLVGWFCGKEGICHESYGISSTSMKILYNCYIPSLPQHLMLWMSVFLCKEVGESSEAFLSPSLPKLFWNDRAKILDLSKAFDVASCDTLKQPGSRIISYFH